MSREESFLTVDMRDIFKHTIFVRHPLEEQYRDLASTVRSRQVRNVAVPGD